MILMTEIRRGDELVVLPETPLEIVRIVSGHASLLAAAKYFRDRGYRRGLAERKCAGCVHDDCQCKCECHGESLAPEKEASCEK